MSISIRTYIPYPIKRRLWLTRLSVRSITAKARLSPTFIIIGTQKGGTTSLYHYLTQHPLILAALEKEVRFFDYKFEKGEAWYHAHFPLKSTAYYWKMRHNREVITGEASPNYLFDPRPPERIMATLPTVKLVIMLRNPIDRAYSSYQMGVRRGWEDKTFAEAIAIEAERTDGELQKIKEDPAYIGHNRHTFSYLARGRYAEQISPWLQFFPREQMLFIKSETFFNNPKDVLTSVFNFLGVPAEVDINYRPHNVGRYTTMDSKIRAQLTAYFEQYNQQLYKMLNRDFGWETEVM